MTGLNTRTTVHATKRAERLAAENTRLRKILSIGPALQREKNLDHLLPLILNEIAQFLEAERATLFLIDWENKRLWTKFASGVDANAIQVPLRVGLVGSCILARKPVNIPYAYESPFFDGEVDCRTGYRTESVLCVPFSDAAGTVCGALEFMNKKTGVFTGEDEALAVRWAGRFAGLDLHTAAGQVAGKRKTRALRRRLNCERGSLFILDAERAEIRSILAEGARTGVIHLDVHLGVAGLAAVTGQDMLLPDVDVDARFNRTFDDRTGFRTRGLVCTPIRNTQGETLGVVEVMNKRKGRFTGEDLADLKTLVSHMAIFMENVLLLEEQEKQFKSLLEVMAASIDAKDPLTAGHSQRVARLAAGIARELGFPDSDADVLYVAALLHDYGKLAVADRVLKKPGKLTAVEFEHMKRHVVSTKTILERMIFSRRYGKVPLVAACHHERLDGSGYAAGLRGREIPFLARILAVADVYEALTARRHYRQALIPGEAFAILEQDVDVKFDAPVVAALKTYLRSIPSGEEAPAASFDPAASAGKAENR